ncbi:MAG: FG-GAP repeat domain-containing protein [Vicinamibacteria bacterium]
MRNTSRVISSMILASAALLSACGGAGAPEEPDKLDESLVLAMAILGKNEDGSPKPLPARAGILTRESGEWRYHFFEDPESNVFHKVMAYGSEGLLTLGGTGAAVKLWRPDGTQETLWEADFGGKFSRMRDAEIGDIYGDGTLAIAVGTHDQGVVAVLRPDGDGFAVEELDREADTVVHEIELGDLDGDGKLEIYATPSAPNKLDGTEQPGKIIRYVPADARGREEVVDLGSRHAKEILVSDVDGDGRDELYISVEAVSGGTVEIRRFDAGAGSSGENVVARLDDKLCRFLTVGDVDGDGAKEMVAATHKKGLWLLRPGTSAWKAELIASDSSGFEHASILADMDGDGRDELYVASDDQGEVRRYRWSAEGWKPEVLMKFEDGLGRFTWNVMVAPVALLPPES